MRVCRDIPLSLVVIAASMSTAAAQSDTTEVALPTSQYGILRAELPDSPGGPQVAVSRAGYVVNFGSREGVKPGSIFQVFEGRRYEKDGYVGLVRVDRVWRDSALVRLVNLERKVNPESHIPLEAGFRLFPKYVLLETVHFDAGRPVFTTKMHERLRYAARFILSFPDFPVVLEGHTDNTGKKDKNEELGRARAEEIAQFLHDIHLIPRGQLNAIGLAAKRPIATNSTPEGRRQNRRVDIVLVDRLSG